MGNDSSKPESKYLPNINSIVDYSKRINRDEILDEPLRNFYIKSSHNSYLGGSSQILTKSSPNNTKDAILKYGARCIEIDLSPSHKTLNAVYGVNRSYPMVSHAGWDSGVSSFEDHCKVIQSVAFQNTSDPLIIYLEINGMDDTDYTRQINNLIKRYLGNRLYEHTFSKLNFYNDFNKYFPNAPIKDLLGKICIVMNYYLSDLKSNEKQQALKNREEFLFPVVHSTTDEPGDGWYSGRGYMIKGQSADDPSRTTFSKLERVFPANTLFSSNFYTSEWFDKGYSIISMNVHINDSQMEVYNSQFPVGGFYPKNFYSNKNGNLEKAIWFNLGFIKNAIWFRNRQYRSNYSISLYHDIGYSDGCSWIVRDDHELTIQSDGNLVYYKKKKPLWNSGTNGNWGAVLIMQSDGNLVIYTTDMKAIWSSGTSGRKTTHAEFLVDGRFVIKNKEEFVKKLN